MTAMLLISPYAIFATSVPQDAKTLIEHLKTVSSSQPAGETPSKAIAMIIRLVTAYRQECNVAGRNAKVSIDSCTVSWQPTPL